MEGKEEDVREGATKFPERQPIGTSAQTHKDYKEPPPAPLFEPGELSSWSFYRAGIAEFMATFLFLYITILTVMGVVKSSSKCTTVGIQGIAWAFGGMIFALVYCTAGISGESGVCVGVSLLGLLCLLPLCLCFVFSCLEMFRICLGESEKGKEKNFAKCLHIHMHGFVSVVLGFSLDLFFLQKMQLSPFLSRFSCLLEPLLFSCFPQLENVEVL